MNRPSPAHVSDPSDVLVPRRIRQGVVKALVAGHHLRIGLHGQCKVVTIVNRAQAPHRQVKRGLDKGMRGHQINRQCASHSSRVDHGSTGSPLLRPSGGSLSKNVETSSRKSLAAKLLFAGYHRTVRPERPQGWDLTSMWRKVCPPVVGAADPAGTFERTIMK
jgi:hypothetical protein